MKTLSKQELTETNGGNSTSASQNGLAGALGIGNLVSFGTASQNGDQASASQFSLGNGIAADLGSILNQGSRNS